MIIESEIILIKMCGEGEGSLEWLCLPDGARGGGVPLRHRVRSDVHERPEGLSAVTFVVDVPDVKGGNQAETGYNKQRHKNK